MNLHIIKYFVYKKPTPEVGVNREALSNTVIGTHIPNSYLFSFSWLCMFLWEIRVC